MSAKHKLLLGAKLLESAYARCCQTLPRPTVTTSLANLAVCQQSAQRVLASPAVYTVVGGLAAYAFFVSSPAALAETNSTSIAVAPAVPAEPPQDVYIRPAVLKGIPKEITLYQYEVCPFCCKVKAFLDYHKIPYRTVEVSPLTKKELKWGEHRKVPVAVLDGDILQDSSLIISRLQAEIEAEQSSSQQQTQPTASSKSSSWKPWSSRSKADSADAQSEATASTSQSRQHEEEAYWRQWVDQRLVKVITVNIYGTAKEAFQTFDYISATGNFNWFEAESARVAGAVMMWGISNKLKKKYGIEGNLREELYTSANQWVDALGDRRFMGGSEPNMADLAVFGVVKSVTGTDTFMDLMHNTSISKWYEHMMGEVGSSSRLSAS